MQLEAPQSLVAKGHNQSCQRPFEPVKRSKSDLLKPFKRFFRQVQKVLKRFSKGFFMSIYFKLGKYSSVCCI